MHVSVKGVERPVSVMLIDGSLKLGRLRRGCPSGSCARCPSLGGEHSVRWCYRRMFRNGKHEASLFPPLDLISTGGWPKQAGPDRGFGVCGDFVKKGAKIVDNPLTACEVS